MQFISLLRSYLAEDYFGLKTFLCLTLILKSTNPIISKKFMKLGIVLEQLIILFQTLFTNR